MRINKSEFVEQYAARCGITISDAKRYVNELIEYIYEKLAQGDEVNFSGFGVFTVSHRMPRLGVNPQSPTVAITIPELRTPKFRAGEAFKEAVKMKQ